MARLKADVSGPHFAMRFPFPGEAELAEQVKEAQRSRSVDVPMGPQLGSRWEWPFWMRQETRCEACNWRGPFEQRERCLGFQRSHVMRS